LSCSCIIKLYQLSECTSARVKIYSEIYIFTCSAFYKHNNRHKKKKHDRYELVWRWRCGITRVTYENKSSNLAHHGIQIGFFPTFPHALSCSYACVAINLMLFAIQPKVHISNRVITDVWWRYRFIHTLHCTFGYYNNIINYYFSLMLRHRQTE